MTNVKINPEEVKQALRQAKIVEASLEKTHKKCEKIISYVNGAKWKGKPRDAFITYIELLEKYHTDVKKNYKKQSKALEKVDKYINDFKNNDISKGVDQL